MPGVRLIHPESPRPSLSNMALMTWNFLLEVDEQKRCFYPASRRWMDPMCPLPQKGDFLQGHTWTDCNYVLLLNFAPYMKETSLFWLYRPVMFCAVWGRGWYNLVLSGMFTGGTGFDPWPHGFHEDSPLGEPFAAKRLLRVQPWG